MSLSKRSASPLPILHAVLTLILVLTAVGAHAADTEPPATVTSEPAAMCLEPAAPEAKPNRAGSCSGSCTTWDDCIDLGCTGSGRCDAGGCLPDSVLMNAPVAPPSPVVEPLKAATECETFDDCMCPGAGRCEKNQCLCL